LTFIVFQVYLYQVSPIHLRKVYLVKKILITAAALLSLAAAPAYAQHYHSGYRYDWRNNHVYYTPPMRREYHGWYHRPSLGDALVGAVVTGALVGATQSRGVYVPPPGYEYDGYDYPRPAPPQRDMEEHFYDGRSHQVPKKRDSSNCFDPSIRIHDLGCGISRYK